MILSDHFISLNIKLTGIFRIISSKYNISFSQFCIIMRIKTYGVSMSELATSLGLDKSTLTRNINRLINRNLVAKYRDAQDLRVYKVILSDEGEQIKGKLYSELDNFTSKLISSFNNEIEDEIYLFDKLIQKLDSYEI